MVKGMIQNDDFREEGGYMDGLDRGIDYPRRKSKRVGAFIDLLI